jgi:hypothetical protein
MIKDFKNFNNMYESKDYDAKIDELINSVLDKISLVGIKNLSDMEKEILKRSSTDRKSLIEYIDIEENPLSYDKLGGILMYDIPYSEWQGMSDDEQEEIKRKRNKTEDKSTDWTDTTLGSKKHKESKGPEYVIRVYKKKGDESLDYMIFWIRGEAKGRVRKFKTISKSKREYGSILNHSSWQNKSVDELHKELDKEYDAYRDLSNKELNLFENFLNLRQHFYHNDKDDPFTNDDKKILDNLFKKFSNL